MSETNVIAEDYASLSCPAVELLAKLHWYLLRSDEKIQAATTKREPISGENVRFVRPVRTDFGREVGNDQIDWWVNRKETDLASLHFRTRKALDSAQVLKAEAKALRRIEPHTYCELLLSLREFAQNNEPHIAVLYEYVRWLYERDPLAAMILFSYRVWGSSRLSDRIVDLNESALSPEDDQIILPLLAQIVLGVFNNSRRQLDRVHAEISYELFEEFGNQEHVERVTVEPERLLRRTTWQVTNECATYFEFIRDSLRNVLDEIEKRTSRENRLFNDAFWRSFILKATGAGTLETDLWDFKEILSFWRVSERDARRRAKLDFARDVASFANARGGCIVVGVTDRMQVVGVRGRDKDLENMLKSAADALSEHLRYPRDISCIRQVLVPGKDGDDVRCIVIAVGQACEVVCVRDGAGQYTYPVRMTTGTSNGDPDELHRRRMHQEADSFEFLNDLVQFVRDN